MYSLQRLQPIHVTYHSTQLLQQTLTCFLSYKPSVAQFVI